MAIAETRQELVNNSIGSEKLRRLSGETVRQKIRSGFYTGQTSGLAVGYLQGNVAILPADFALDIFRFG